MGLIEALSYLQQDKDMATIDQFSRNRNAFPEFPDAFFFDPTGEFAVGGSYELRAANDLKRLVNTWRLHIMTLEGRLARQGDVRWILWKHNWFWTTLQ